jgi:serine/threonine protein kinase
MHRNELKILDFGLAKSTTMIGAPTASAVADEGTLSIAPQLTNAGTALGTIPYMSPEQARGEKVDVRTDLFSFGVILYEMTTGRRPFAGLTAAVLFDALLNRHPLAPKHLDEGQIKDYPFFLLASVFLLLVAGLLAGVVGVIKYGWQNPGDTIGAAVWLVLALSVVTMIRRESRNPS